MGNYNRNKGRQFGAEKSRFGGRARFGSNSSSRSEVEMHDVICDKCGVQCQVPFRPTGSKPTFCRDCFKKSESSYDEEPQKAQFNKPDTTKSNELASINKKLDLIIQLLRKE